MRVTYVGPHDAVEIPLLDVAVKRGESIDVPAEVGHELVKQDAWETANLFQPGSPDDADGRTNVEDES